MKYFTRVLIFCLAVCTIFSGCSEDTAEKIKNTVKLGMIAQMNATPEQMDEVMEIMGVDTATTFYDNFNSMQAALSAKKVDEIQTHRSVANYMASRDAKFHLTENHAVTLKDSFCMAVRDGDLKLKDGLDSAIKSMKEDGTLEVLIKKYIDDLKDEPPAVDIPKIDGAETIKVGITGDMPPLDLILPDGTPAGFNTAVLAEISRRIGKNIELVQIESPARAAALTSKRVDAVFWVIVPAEGNSKRPTDMDKPAGIEVTDSYYEDAVVNVSLGQAVGGLGN